MNRNGIQWTPSAFEEVARGERKVIEDDLAIKFLGDVQRLRLSPGDIVVLSAAASISDECARRLVAMIKKAIGTENKVLVFGDGLRIGVVAPDQPK